MLCAGIFSLDHAAMGLTVLAMGNSLGDMAADLAVARSGKPNMAVTACYAGPFFNMCIGTETAGPPFGLLSLIGGCACHRHWCVVSRRDGRRQGL